MIDSLVPSTTNRALPASQLAQQWPDGKRRLDDLQSELYRLGTNVPGASRAAHLGAVSAALAALHQSLEHDVVLRSPDAPSSPEHARALDDSVQSVSRRRDTLVAAIEDRPPAPGHEAS